MILRPRTYISLDVRKHAECRDYLCDTAPEVLPGHGRCSAAAWLAQIVWRIVQGFLISV